jgi:ribosomal protein S1
VNDPLTFLTFVSEHPIGSAVEGAVSSFVSHGAMVDVDGMQCYVPLAGLASPPPSRAREVLERGQRVGFVLVALDPARRGAELALPALAAARLDH